jgi:hypothetical protein
MEGTLPHEERRCFAATYVATVVYARNSVRHKKARFPNDFGWGNEEEDMGRYYYNKKDTVEDCRRVSISFLRKNRCFDSPWPQSITWTNSDGETTASMTVQVHTAQDGNYVRLSYTMTDRDTGKATDFDYKVQLVTTPCHFGGVRWWFICPLIVNGITCGRRVAMLYRAPFRDYYGCRHCYNLSYESRNERHRGWWGKVHRCCKLAKQAQTMASQQFRFMYGGRPTRKATKFFALKRRLDELESVWSEGPFRE